VILSLLRASKDAALAFGARKFLNANLRGIGQMSELSIDTQRGTIRARLDLLGEAEPIEIDVLSYKLEQRGDEMVVTILDATASREWLAETLRQFVVGRSFTIPPQAGAVLKLLT
jgi:hypothetical protein